MSHSRGGREGIWLATFCQLGVTRPALFEKDDGCDDDDESSESSTCAAHHSTKVYTGQCQCLGKSALGEGTNLDSVLEAVDVAPDVYEEPIKVEPTVGNVEKAAAGCVVEG